MAPKAGRIELDLNDAVAIAVEMSNVKGNKDINIPYLVGPPGIGKTRMIQSLLSETGYGCLSFTPGLERLEKFGGIPDMTWKDQEYKTRGKDGKIETTSMKELHTLWSVPELVSKAREAAKHHEKVFILLDDWHLAPAAIQSIGFELFTHKALSGAKLPKNIYFILAGNESSAAGAKTQLSAIINRCTVIPCKPNVKYWIENFAIPNGIHESGISFFARIENASLFNMDESTSGQFATPRSWTSAFLNLAHFERASIPGMKTGRISNSMLKALISGDIGEAAAAKFWEYYAIYKDIDAATIFKTGKFDIPNEPVKRFAFGAACAAEYYNIAVDKYKKRAKKEEKAELYKVTKILSEIIDALQKNFSEVAIMTMKTVSDKKENKELGLPSGQMILADLAGDKVFDLNALRNIAKATQRIREIEKS